jgi:uncharacterized protein
MEKKGRYLQKKILDSLKITSEKEIEIICEAIFYHCDKENRHSDFTEILIDADIIQPYMYNALFQTIDNNRANRLNKIKNEFGI